MTEPDAPAPGAQPAPPAVRRPRHRLFSGIRARLMLSSVLILAAAIAVTVVVVRRAIDVQLDRRLDADLVQESQELRRLAGGTDPDTGRPFGDDLRRVFEVFFERNVPARDEAFLSFVGGELFMRTRPVTEFRLETDERLIRRWTAVAGERQSLGGEAETPEGVIRYLAVPIGRGGVFVAAIFRDVEAAELQPAMRAVMWVGLAMLLIGSILAWRIADRVLRPVEVVTTTARSITETDLSRRIPVEGDDEIARLSRTFNDMLERLQSAFAAQRAFVDDAGHELRTPITIVRGHLELLDDDPDRRRESIALVMDELDRMSRIVNDLLLLAKAEEPDFLDLSVVDVRVLTEELFAKCRGLAPRDWEIESVGRGRVVADRQRITQALLQLADNAVRHTSEGDLVSLGSLVLDGEARLWVRDTGPGIPYEDQDRIFDRFTRGRARRSSEGAGLGLAIVQAIAVAHRGRVELRSRPGAGATFTVVIPTDQPEPVLTQDLPVAGAQEREDPQGVKA